MNAKSLGLGVLDAIVKIVKVGVGNVERLNERYYLLKWHIIQFFYGMHSNIKVGK